jgi:peroxiredoxin
MKSSGIVVPAIVIALVAGCSKPPNDSARAATSAAPSAAPTPSMVPPPSAAAAPPRREYSAPAPERLGVLAPGTGIPVGQKVPDLSARNLDGAQVTLSSLYAKGPILLAFYRGGWCHYCNSEIHALTVAYPEYRKRGVMPVAVSVDKPEALAKMRATNSILFPVLSDSDAAMIEAFHVVRNVGDDELAKMKGFGVDLESYSGKMHHKIAIPALFLIDRTGVVRWAHSDPDFKVRPSTAQILSAIDTTHLS